MRETYRLNKQQQLYPALQLADKNVLISVGYVGKGIEPYLFFEKKMLKLLNQLSSELAAANVVTS